MLDESNKKYHFIKLLVTGLKKYHHTTYLHSVRVSHLTYLISQKWGLPKEEQIYNAMGGLLHDIGKKLIPISLLEKPAPLSELEYEIMREHPIDGAEMLKLFPPLEELVPAVLYHHERLDGSGYPFGTNIIPLSAQIIGVCDSFDAMTTERPYNKKRLKSITEAIAELKSQPQKYNYKVVEALEEILKEGSDVRYKNI
ncbi:phosphohydrolase [Caldanaerobacter subterraneus subsp. yonseiensis KB-1]|uniref:Phosphohydrolase n=2 Tax=Caldanaerobacter subterraneus TaxID=911092 RepID=U5CTJ0_CALSX|nr:HD domain-containing phosphohydrolase [Caldanaerobacter subterraneus]ERM92266.1 phosphohydrolase [Caldanaerobacter subterraneus subsp. yonseiensis KB-1]KKC29374.1 HD-GYP domain-containing protein [Caldanaerobacter subterraneus subsp. pacificus DSM 12653]